MTWQYLGHETPEGVKVVGMFHPNGSFESRVETDEVIQSWIAEGNAILPPAEEV